MTNYIEVCNIIIKEALKIPSPLDLNQEEEYNSWIALLVSTIATDLEDEEYTEASETILAESREDKQAVVFTWDDGGESCRAEIGVRINNLFAGSLGDYYERKNQLFRG